MLRWWTRSLCCSRVDYRPSAGKAGRMREIGVRVSEWWTGLSFGGFAAVVALSWVGLAAMVTGGELVRRWRGRRVEARRRATVERMTRVLVVRDVTRV